MRPKLLKWLESKNLRPHIVGEFDDSALMKSFGHAGAGVFVALSAIAEHVCDQYKVARIGRIESVLEQLYAIKKERRISHPAIVAISRSARRDVAFGTKP